MLYKMRDDKIYILPILVYSFDTGKCKFLYSKIHQIMLKGIVQARKKADNVTCHLMRICNISVSKIPVIIGKKLEKRLSVKQKK